MGVGQGAWQKKVKVSSDDVTYYDLPATTASLNWGGDVLEDTDMATNQGYRSRIYGLKDWSLSATSNWAPGFQGFDLLLEAWQNRTPVWVKYLPNGQDDSGFKGKAIVETFNLSGDVGGLETVEISLQAAGPLGPAATP